MTAELVAILDRTARAIDADGTRTRSRTLQAMAAATRDLCPGAAAALVDWDGSEMSRLRAFGIVYGALLREASEDVLRQLIGASSHELAA